MTNFIDNRNGNTMAQALRRAFGDVTVSTTAENYHNHTETTPPQEVRIATAYFNPSGFQYISKALSKVEQVKLMLGVDLPIEAYFRQRKLGQSVERWQGAILKKRLNLLQQGIETERNFLPFNAETANNMRALIKGLRNGNIEVRRYDDNFMHAKAYIYTNRANIDTVNSGILAGSSNLTAAGLTKNLELNLGKNDKPTTEQAVAWFDSLWEDAIPIDLAKLYEEQFLLREPWFIFLRVLYQLYGDEINEEVKSDTSKLILPSFQQHGVMRALRLLEKNRGTLVADEVGLGKTFIAGEIIYKYRERGQRTLLICPASLRDSTWKSFLHKHQLYCECYSYHELANDSQLSDSGSRTILQMPKDEYQLIVVDEAHNYRNPDTPARAQILRKLLSGRRKELLLLTATPVNNSLWDLHTLLHYFIRQDSNFVDQGIVSMRQRFKEAAQLDPFGLSPDMLYPIIDATTVKRTRQFIKKHYGGDTINLDGQKRNIVFPDPVPITVKYDLEAGAPNLLKAVFNALDPDTGTLAFARYRMVLYQKKSDEYDNLNSVAVVGLLRSALLKRFESSSSTFSISLKRILSQYQDCLDLLERGYVAIKKFDGEYFADEEASIEEILADVDERILFPTSQFEADRLKKDLISDSIILNELINAADQVTPTTDPKLKTLRVQLEKIVKDANNEATNKTDEIDKRKVLIFSFFTDTVNWVYQWLLVEVDKNPKLAPLRGRIGKVSSGEARVEEDEVARDEILSGFAPISMERPTKENKYDILVSTDVLAEGVNLQQCRHIVNYDLPWNPMRLVQRHGRIDRIGSRHKRVFLRSIFPDKLLDKLLQLEQRILDKIAMAAATVGVQRPVEGARSGAQVFTETKEELKKIFDEDASFYENGGGASAAQTGEEYRQTLRKALVNNEDDIKRMPWKVGSCMKKGKDRGIFFSAYIGDKPQLCFVRAGDNWLPVEGENAIEAELGFCLRLIEADERTEKNVLPFVEDRLYAFWARAEEYFYNQWKFKTDPRNLEPAVSKINRDVIQFIEDKSGDSVKDDEKDRAIKILASVWGRRDETKLRAKFKEVNPESGTPNVSKVQIMVDWVNHESGMPPLEPPQTLVPIEKEDIKLLCWMVVRPAQ